jgi:hypothetical protein
VLQHLLDQQVLLLLELQQAYDACVQASGAAGAAAGGWLADPEPQERHRQVPPALVEAANKLAAGLQAFGLAVAVQFPAAALCCSPCCVNLAGTVRQRCWALAADAPAARWRASAAKSAAWQHGRRDTRQSARGSRQQVQWIVLLDSSVVVYITMAVQCRRCHQGCFGVAALQDDDGAQHCI